MHAQSCISGIDARPRGNPCRWTRAVVLAPVHFAIDHVLIYCCIVKPAVSVDVFPGFGILPYAAEVFVCQI